MRILVVIATILSTVFGCSEDEESKAIDAALLGTWEHTCAWATMVWDIDLEDIRLRQYDIKSGELTHEWYTTGNIGEPHWYAEGGKIYLLDARVRLSGGTGQAGYFGDWPYQVLDKDHIQAITVSASSWQRYGRSE